MLKPMFGHRAKPRKFDMPTRYYDPEKEKKRRQRMKFESNRKRHRAQNMRVLLYVFGLIFVIWVITAL
jgi:hypothetical protein